MKEALMEIAKEFYAAKQKHPEFAKTVAEGLNLITEEYLELTRACNDKESPERIKEEAAHVGVCVLRFLEMMNEQ